MRRSASLLRRVQPCLFACSSSSVASVQVAAGRGFCSSGDQEDVSTIGSPKVRQMAEDIMALSVLEASWLSEILRKKLKMERPAFGGGMPMMMAAPAAAPATPAGAPAEAPEEKKEKTEFTVKLEGFSADGKIKVIKEIRAITSLGLKEAKELVSEPNKRSATDACIEIVETTWL